MSDKLGQNVEGEISSPSTSDSPLSLFHVMAREMHFGPRRATSIDLCVRDLVAASRFGPNTKIIAEKVDEPFSGFTVDTFPPTGRAQTYARANYIARKARLERPDVVIVQQHLPTAAALARRMPELKVILHRHNFTKAVERGQGISDRIRGVFRKRRYAQLSGIVHVSEACAAGFAQTWPDVPVPSCVVYNGLDFTAWAPSAERSQEIVLVGRCAPEKGVVEAAEAIAAALEAFSNWRARLILSNVETHPDYFARLREIVSPHSALIRLETQLTFAQVKAACEQAAIAVVPSKSQEPFGRTALEAHAGGAALISSGTGGLREISGSAALMLPAVTPQAIAAAIRQLIEKPELRESLAREGAERVRARFDIRTQASRLDSFCQAVASGAAMGRRPLSETTVSAGGALGAPGWEARA